MTSVTNIKNRLVTLCQQIPGVVTVLDAYPDDETPFQANQLPAIVVRPSWRAAIARQSSDTYLMTMTYVLELNAALSGSKTALVDEASIEALEPFVVSIVQFFGRRPRLEHNDAGLAISCELPQLVGSTRQVRGGVTYARLFFALDVTTRHNIRR